MSDPFGVINFSELTGEDGFFLSDGGEPLDFRAFDFVGDVNADGFDDIAITDNSGTFIIFGRPSGFDEIVNFSDLSPSEGLFIPDTFGDELFTTGANGVDINGDGIADIVSGDAIIFGSPDLNGSLDLSDLNRENGFILGRGRITDVADINGDGFGDLLVSTRSSVFVPNAVIFGGVGFGQVQPTPVDENEIVAEFGANGVFTTTVATGSEDQILSISLPTSAAISVRVAQTGGPSASTFPIDFPSVFTERETIVVGVNRVDGNDTFPVFIQSTFRTTNEASITISNTSEPFVYTLTVTVTTANGFPLTSFVDFENLISAPLVTLPTPPEVRNIGDINADGIDDQALFIDGAQFVVFDPDLNDEASIDAADLNASNSLQLPRGASFVENVGDFDGDGIDDFAATDDGRIYVIFGQEDGFDSVIGGNGVVDFDEIDGLNGFDLNENIRGISDFRISFSGGGDINGDGFDDILFSSQQVSLGNGVFDQAATFAIFGRERILPNTGGFNDGQTVINPEPELPNIEALPTDIPEGGEVPPGRQVQPGELTNIIRFNEVQLGSVNPTFNLGDNLVMVRGVTVEDAALSSPSIFFGEDPIFGETGPIFINFEQSVDAVSFTLGFLNQTEVATVQYLDTQGGVLFQTTNDVTGVVDFSFANDFGIGGVRIIGSSFEPLGFSLDDLQFGDPLELLPPPSVELTLLPAEQVIQDINFREDFTLRGTLGPDDEQDIVFLNLTGPVTVNVTVSLDSNPTDGQFFQFNLFDDNPGLQGFAINSNGFYSETESYTVEFDFISRAPFPTAETAITGLIFDEEAGAALQIINFAEIGGQLAQRVAEFRGNPSDLFEELGRGAGILGTAARAFGIAGHVDNVLAAASTPGADASRQLFIEVTDFLASVAASTAGTFVLSRAGALLGPPGAAVGAAIGGTVGGLLYSTQLSEFVRERAGDFYDNAINPDGASGPMPDAGVSGATPSESEATQTSQEQSDEADTFNIEDLIFDEEFYLANNPDAVEAVASGEAANAFAHFLTVGLERGAQANANSPVFTTEDLANDLSGINPVSFFNTALFTQPFDDLSGDGLSQVEFNLFLALNAQSRALSSLTASLNDDDQLSALANRIARDAVLNSNIDLARPLDPSELGDLVSILSTGEDFRAAFAEFSGLDIALGDNIQVFAVASDGIDLAVPLLSSSAFFPGLLESFFGDIDLAELVFDPATQSIGIAEFGGLVVVLLDTNANQNDARQTGDADVTRLFGSGSVSTLMAGGSRGDIVGGDGVDFITGSHLRDTLAGNAGDDVISGGAERDIITGGSGNDVIDGGASTDFITGGSGDDIIAGGSGQDLFIFDLSEDIGADRLTDFSGNGNADNFSDFIQFTQSPFFDFDTVITFARQEGENVVFEFDDGNSLTVEDTQLAELSSFNVEVFASDGGGEDFGDTVATAGQAVVGEPVAGRIDSGDIDVLGATLEAGVSYRVTLTGARTNGGSSTRLDDLQVFRVFDAEGNELTFNGNNFSSSISGANFELTFFPDADGTFFFEFGSQVDNDSGNYQFSVIAVAAATGTSGNDRLEGGDGDDRIFGFEGDDTLRGGNGNDALLGDDGNDVLEGGAGIDNLSGGAGNDVLDGGDGDNDAANFFGDPLGVVVDLAAGTAQDGFGGTDTLTGIEDITSSDIGDDTLLGSVADNFLSGRGGNDLLEGRGGNDRLEGGDGDDSLDGGAGNDRLNTFAGGADRLTGGAGADTFIIDDLGNLDGVTTNAVITDLEAMDVIELFLTTFEATTFDEILNAATEVDADVVINLGGGNTLTILGTTVDALLPEQFGFAAAPASVPPETPDDDFGNTVETAGSAAIGEIVSGSINPTDDIDVIGVELQGGVIYTIALRGSDSGSGDLSDPRILRVLGADGSVVDAVGNDDGGTGFDSLLTFIPDADGTFFFEFGSFGGSSQGTYEFEVQELGPDDFGDTIETAGTAVVGEILSGELEIEGDVDLIGIELEAGVTYRINVRGEDSGSGTAERPIISGIFDAGGELLSSGDSGSGVGSDALALFTPRESGTFFLEVSTFSFSDPGTYQFDVSELNEPLVFVSAFDSIVNEHSPLLTNDLFVGFEDTGVLFSEEVEFSLSGPDADFFSISTFGDLTLNTEPDFENPSDSDGDNIFNVTVTATVGSFSTDQEINFTVADLNEAPTLSDFGDTDLTIEEDSGPQIIDGDVTFADPDNNFDGGSLILSGLADGDVVSINNAAATGGDIGFDGTNVSFDGTVIGTVIGTVTGGDDVGLVVSLNAAANSAAVEALIENLTLDIPAGAPEASRELVISIEDANGLTLGSSTFTATTDDENPFAEIDASGFERPSLADIDGDGDVDLIVQNAAEGTIEFFRNDDGDFVEATGEDNPFGSLVEAVFSLDGLSFADLDGDGDLDAITESFSSSTPFTFLRNDDGTFVAVADDDNPFQNLGFLGFGLSPTFVDIDGDEDEDVITGTGFGLLEFLRNDGDTFVLTTDSETIFDVRLDVRPSVGFADVDGDGDLDAFIGTGAGSVVFFRNVGDATNPVFTEASGTDNPFDGVTVEGGAPVFADIDGDGDADAITISNGGIDFFRNDTVPNNTATVSFVATAESEEPPQEEPPQSEEPPQPEPPRPEPEPPQDEDDNEPNPDSGDDPDNGTDEPPENVIIVFTDEDDPESNGMPVDRDVSTGNGNDLIETGSGNDVIESSGGDNQIDGGDGNDNIDLGEGSDFVIHGGGDDVVMTGGGNDRIFAGSGESAGDDEIFAGAGDDIAGGGAGNDVVDGGEGADIIFGREGDDLIIGGSGNDELFNGIGSDTVLGGDGNDTLWGGAGDDLITGGSGADTFIFGQVSGNDTVSDFNTAEDILDLRFAEASFTSLEEVQSATNLVIENGDIIGVIIDLGDSQSITILGIDTSQFEDLNIVI